MSRMLARSKGVLNDAQLRYKTLIKSHLEVCLKFSLFLAFRWGVRFRKRNAPLLQAIHKMRGEPNPS